MVGLNHEFARKLLWREYPDRPARQLLPAVLGRGRHHRQRGPERGRAEREALRHPRAAPLAADLGSGRAQQPRRARAAAAPQAVLIIRGELLKKYPNAVIFAQHAKMRERPARPPTGSRRREESAAAASEDPHAAVRGAAGSRHLLLRLRSDDRRGEGRRAAIPAGSSSSRSGRASRASVSRSRARRPIETFDELTWDDAMPGGEPGQFLPASAASRASRSPSLPPSPTPTSMTSGTTTRKWTSPPSARRAGRTCSSAQPVMVAVHADEMLAENRP